jgi:hypothetical protein
MPSSARAPRPGLRYCAATRGALQWRPFAARWSAQGPTCPVGRSKHVRLMLDAKGASSEVQARMLAYHSFSPLLAASAHHQRIAQLVRDASARLLRVHRLPRSAKAIQVPHAIGTPQTPVSLLRRIDRHSRARKPLVDNRGLVQILWHGASRHGQVRRRVTYAKGWQAPSARIVACR